MNDRYSQLREDYDADTLEDRPLVDTAADPVALFNEWFQDAQNAGLAEPNAMVLSTVSAHGLPNSRTVLLKGVDEGDFTFFTNLESAKGDELATTPRCALLFPWHQMYRQIRIQGDVSLSSRAEVDRYFATRPRGSQLGAWASAQSRPIDSRADLEASYRQAEQRFDGAEVVAPEHWGGYRVTPQVYEFWHGRRSRLHDRLRFVRQDQGWSVQRLQP